MARPVPEPRAIGAAYDAIATEFDLRMSADPRTRARFRVLDAAQRRAVAGRERVLELGCATARLLGGVRAPLRVGVDASAGLLAEARRRGVLVVRGDAHRLPFADRSFDAILAGVSVLRYLDYARALAECARVLAPGGVLSVHVQTSTAWSPRHLVRGGEPGDPLDARSLDEVRAPAAAAGFDEVRPRLWRSVRFWPYLVPLPARLPLPLWHHALLTLRRRPG